MRLALMTSALALCLPLSAAAQDASQDEHPLPLVSSDDLTTYFFTPAHVPLRELRSLAQQLYGRHIYLEDRGGYNSSPIQNLQSLGDSLIIYDVQENAQRIGEALHGLDNQAANASAPRPSTTVAEWSPDHISLDSAKAALATFSRLVQVYDDSGNMSEVHNYSVVPEQDVLVIRDAPRQTEEMLALLERVDRPETQVLVTCMLVAGTHAPAQGVAPLPDDLIRDLRRLVPYEHFATRAVGMVRSSVRSAGIEIKMEGGYRLDLRPEAYDADAQQLTVSVEFSGRETGGFETHTTVSTDEYTVLGVTGGQPLFTVLRIRSVGS